LSLRRSRLCSLSDRVRAAVLAIALAAAVPPSVSAELDGEAPEKPVRFPTLVVEEPPLAPDREQSEEQARAALRQVPGSVDLVGAARIERTRAFDLQDVLSMVPGVYVRARGFGEEPQLSVRGSGLRSNFHTRGINVLLDGFPFQNADGFSDVESLEMLAIDRLEVWKGGNALRFGANSLGGALNLVTRTGLGGPFVEARSEAGSFGFWKSWLAAGQRLGETDVFGGVSHVQRDGYRDHADGNRQRLFANAGHRFDGGARLRFDVHLARNQAKLPGALTRRELRDDPRAADPESVRQDAARDFEFARAAASLWVPISEHDVVEAALQANYHDLWHPLPFSIIDNETTNTTTELRWISTRPLAGRDNRFTAGLQLAGTRQPETFWDNVEGRRGRSNKKTLNLAANVGGYVENRLALSERLAVVAGTRVQWAVRTIEDRLGDDSEDSVDHFTVSPTLGFTFTVMPDIQVYGNATRMNEVPLLLELAAPGNLDGSLDDLRVQEAWQFELGTRGQHGDRLRWDVAIFDWEVQDEIRNLNVVPFPGAPFTLPRYQNIDRTRHLGIEAGAEVLVARGLLGTLGLPGEDTLELALSYTWSRFTFERDPAFDGNRLPGVPEHFLRAELRVDHGSGFWLTPGVEWVPQGAYVDSGNESRAPGYALLDLRLGYDHEATGIGVYFEARNLTDRDFASALIVDAGDGRSFEPGDGRSFTGGISWRW
jgi:iron complex outermembrane receptor protein